MPTFTVHAPPRRDGEAPASPERFAFVRDGFHGWAFLLAPFWLIARRLWLALVLYVVVSAAVATVLALLGASGSAQGIAAFCIALLIGTLPSAASSHNGRQATRSGPKSRRRQ